MTPRVLPFVPQTSYFTRVITSVRFCPFRIEAFTCFSQCQLHTKRKWSVNKILVEVETDEDSENFSDYESFSDHDTESEEDGDSGNEEVNNTEWFSSKDGIKWKKRKLTL
ncbi:hypothetical protein AVEN_145753-1 [Araneus ventricosus]|uniref:Uncharacterized protein n=1 Tax=Araneus ventricosus TaxID=182803 RepID=A0A4Y2SBH2_ARAVE|nr:hypothetical protein AVEN_206593-1 [Araneus ventricosus]GBN85361.1 hypothetical protein AVEN_145753-1 [Araneus ventricosus]